MELIGCIIKNRRYKVYCYDCSNPTTVKNEDGKDERIVKKHECPRLIDKTQYCDRMVFRAISDDVINCRFEIDVDRSIYPGKAIDGVEISWETLGQEHYDNKWRSNRKLLSFDIKNNKAITKIWSDFNFSFTTDDSDFTIFEPFIDYIRRFIEFKHIDKLAHEVAYAYTCNFKDISVLNNLERRTQEIIDHYTPIIEVCVKSTVEDLLNVFRQANIEYKWATPIAKTITDALVAKYITSKMPTNKKTCPHMGT